MIWSVFTIPARAGLGAIFRALFKITFTTAVGKLLIFTLVNIGMYFLVVTLLPDWFNTSKLTEFLNKIGEYPVIVWVMETFQIYTAFKLGLVVLVTAWVIKKIPGWAFLGPIMKVTK